MKNKLVAKIIPEMPENEKKLKVISAQFCLFSLPGGESGENDHILILSADWLENYTPLTEEM